MKVFEILSESQIGKRALDYERSNRYPDGKDIPESLPKRYQSGDNPGVPNDQRCSNCEYYCTETHKCYKFKGDPKVRPAYWCAKWEPVKEEVTESVKQRLDAKCWKGKHKEGTKIKGGVRVNNCVPNESIGQTHISPSGVKTNMPPTDDDYEINYGKQGLVAKDRKSRGVDVATGTKDVDEDWQKTNKKDKTDGMSKKAVNAYRRENPGSKLKTAVTKDPSKIKKGSNDDSRRKSFCARSNGQKKMHNIDCSADPDKAICKARRRWNC